MKKILLSYDEKNHQTALRLIKSDVTVLNSLVTTITDNTDKIEITKANIENLINDPKGFIFDMIVDKSSMNFNGVPISRKKAMELVEFPKEFEAVINKAESVKETLKGTSYKIDDSFIDKIKISDLDLVSNVLKLRESYLEGIKNDFSTYTRNENQNKAIECITNIFNSINDLKGMKFISSTSIENNGLEDLGLKFYGGELKLDLEQVKRLR